MEKKDMSATGNHRAATGIVIGAVLVGVFAVGMYYKGQTSSTVNQTLSASSDKILDPMYAFAQCMRDHGIPSFPEPVGGGINLNGTGLDPSTPEFEAAHAACVALLPRPPQAGGLNGPHPSGTGERRAGGRVRPGNNSAWQKVVPGGDCACADSSEFAFWDHKADVTKVVFYLDGGGVCFDAASCANQNTPTTGEREGPDYDPNIEGENPGGEGGMFDLTRAENPFREYSFIYVPLCTADAHLGNANREYSSALTVEHKGFVNGMAALDYLAKHYPDATQVVVLGKTAGASAAPVYGGLAADLLPDARVTVFGAQSGAFPDDADLNARIGELWGAFDTMPDWEVNEGLTARDWGSRRFWIQAGLHNPDIVLARFDYAFDSHATETLKYLSVEGVDPSNTLAVINGNEAAIEAAGVVLHSYTAPGEGHGILEFEEFYSMEVSGVTLVDWIKALIDGEPLDDVR